MNVPGLEETLRRARQVLLAERNGSGWWEGELSSSALSTATAVVALSLVDRHGHAAAIEAGCEWLVRHRNEDGGWGDTVQSHSNLSTTLLVWSALSLARPQPAEELDRAGAWISRAAGNTAPETIVRAVTGRYGRDRTFAVPILMTCAICGRLGGPSEAWRRVLPLPFELAAFPRSWFAALRFPVVSYALPALIAIGFARNAHAPPPLWGRLRRWIWPRVSNLLERIQPPGGGFLEAAPLTSFVTMALASAGQKEHPVVRRGVEFLTRGQRPDGSWPIDTNLSVWVTTLAVRALMGGKDPGGDLDAPGQASLQQWLLAKQHLQRHPYTHAAPGGWAWTDLPGGVPDADDTPGALLALSLLAGPAAAPEVRAAAERGIAWLLDLQNPDGGIPTFCRGWGTLPFDRSSPDLTAHALRAWNAWRDHVNPRLAARLRWSAERALAYLARTREPEGAWVPLWFGNQDEADEANRTYGTSQVLQALAEIREWLPSASGLALRSQRWLVHHQHADGGWGGGTAAGSSSLEETALAVRALCSAGPGLPGAGDAIRRGAVFLVERTGTGTRFPASPIGLYFAKLWYFERLYPVIWTVSALHHAQKDPWPAGGNTGDRDPPP